VNIEGLFLFFLFYLFLFSDGSVLVTSYSTYMLDYKKILAAKWNYVILDEGHKIRNPEAKVF